MAKEYLGEFEELILTMVAALQEDAYGAAIALDIEEKLKREVNLSAVHVTLYRLEDKGYIKSALGGGTKERGGRKKKDLYDHQRRNGNVESNEGSKNRSVEAGATAENIRTLKLS
ncbi:MAG: hypothetical protein WDN75_06285 [Bacteroidota bacterium]